MTNAQQQTGIILVVIGLCISLGGLIMISNETARYNAWVERNIAAAKAQGLQSSTYGSAPIPLFLIILSLVGAGIALVGGAYYTMSPTKNKVICPNCRTEFELMPEKCPNCGIIIPKEYQKYR